MKHFARFEDDPCGCDNAASPSARLISLEIALARGLALATPVEETITWPLGQATGRVLAGEAVATTPLPAFDNSAMDGYAVRVADLRGDGPWRLPVGGRIAAGDPGDLRVEPGEAARIFTGAPVPSWADAVVMQEHVRRDGESIVLEVRPRVGLNIRRVGEDLCAGGRILPAGVEIGSREAAALAAVGQAAVTVRRRIRVAMFCSGSELRAPGEELQPGQIWNSNRFMLLAALAKPWIDLIDLGVVPDDPTALTEALVAAARHADIVISTGGVSVGDEDHMPKIFRAAGGDIHAMRVAMKPGKPVVLGTMDKAIYLGLPGNPVAAFVTWKVIGEPIVRKSAGLAMSQPAAETVVADFDLRRRPGRCEYRPARFTDAGENGARHVDVLTPSYSARIATLAAADGFLIIPADVSEIRAGAPLAFLPLHST